MKRSRTSIGVNLFFGIFGSVVVVFLAFSFLSSRRAEDAWESSFEQHAGQTTAVIERVLRQGMLLKKKEAVHAALRDVSTAPGIRSIRIYDKYGEVKFSTDTHDLKTKIKQSAELCVLCHDTPFGRAKEQSKTRTLRDPSGALVMGQARMIKNSSQCAGADCHAPPEQREYLGVMDFQMSMAVIEQGTKSARRGTFYAAGLMALVGGLATYLSIWRFVQRPVRRLVDGTRKVAAGDLGVRVEVDRGRELQVLAESFNQMSAELAAARARSEQWEEELAAAIARKTRELGAAQRHIVHMEKMASLGKLAATVAHELNNPLGGILVYAKLIQRELPKADLPEKDKEEILRYVEVVRSESARCGDIVKNLLTFARQSKNVFAEHNLNPIIDRSLMTVQHLLKSNGIEHSVEHVAGDDRLTCDANEIQQALVALLVNAAEAMPSGGQLRVEAEASADDLTISITDTGVGIPPEVLPEIFEPFVSTKGDKGVGLGLAVVYGIIRRHEADIDVSSKPGAGTTFRITLPRHPKPPPSASTPTPSNTKVVSSGK